MVSLDNFATAQRQAEKKHRKCVTCNLPSEILSQVEAARPEDSDEKMPYKIICQWLSSNPDEGLSYNIPTTTLTNHFSDSHHLGK